MDVKYDNPLLEVVITLYKNAREFSWERVIDLVIHGPKYYEIWWSNLFREAPLHVVIETTLVLFIIWLLFIRKTVDPKKSSKADNLSRKEVQWLLDTWEPEPLVPDLDYKHQQIAQSMVVSLLVI